MWMERASKVAIVLVDCATSGADLSGSENDMGLPLIQLRDVIHKVYISLSHMCAIADYCSMH